MLTRKGDNAEHRRDARLQLPKRFNLHRACPPDVDPPVQLLVHLPARHCHFFRIDDNYAVPHVHRWVICGLMLASNVPSC